MYQLLYLKLCGHFLPYRSNWNFSFKTTALLSAKDLLFSKIITLENVQITNWWREQIMSRWQEKLGCHLDTVGSLKFTGRSTPWADRQYFLGRQEIADIEEKLRNFPTPAGKPNFPFNSLWFSYQFMCLFWLVPNWQKLSPVKNGNSSKRHGDYII